MTSGPPDQSIVVGGGITGALLATRLARRGENVLLVDRRPDLRVRDLDKGRSINLALSTRGLDALSRIGLDEVVCRDAVSMRGRRIHNSDGDLGFQPYGTDPDQVLQSVNRDTLTATLLDAVDAEGSVRTAFSTRVRDVNLTTNQVLIDEGGELDHQPFGTVFGADGAYSAVRLRLQKTGRFDYRQDFLAHGYKELTIPSEGNGEYRMEPDALHIWPRGTHMMIALPNPDGSFTATLFWPYSGPTSFEEVTTGGQAIAVFEQQFADALPLIPDLAEQYETSPVSSLVTVRCGPWHVDDRVVLLGDAAHGVVPFYGQGANAAMEDVTILVDMLDRHQDRARAFAAFYEERKGDADALAQLAVDNYLEMRDNVASRWFLLRRGLERGLHRLAPSVFVPLYTMVTFTRMPYAEAVERSARQSRLISATLVAVALAALASIVAVVVVLTA